MDMDLEQLLQMTITSVSKQPQLLEDTAAAVYVITQEDIRTSGVTSIPEAMAMAPGIQVARISASKWSISSRGFPGFTSNKLLVMIDGRSVYSPAYSGVFWDMQHTLLEDIDRIEVIRGPGGTIWGANAVNGVINIITRKAQNTQGTLVRGGIGDQEQLTGAFRYGRKIGNSAFGRVYVTGNQRDSNQLSGSGIDARDGWHTLQAGFRADGTTANEQGSWTLQGDVFQNAGDQIIFPYWIETPPYLVDNATDLDSSGFNLLGRWQQQLSDQHSLTAQVYYDQSSRNEDFFDISYDTLDLELQHKGRFGDLHSITTGAGFRSITGDEQERFQAVLPGISSNLYSVYTQDAINLWDDHLVLTLGVKWEHNDYTGSEWQPSGKLLWKPVPHHSLWASVARAVHTPSANERGGRVTINAFPPPLGQGLLTLAGSDAFESENALAYEAGYRWQYENEFSFDLALFYNDYDSIYTVYPEPVPGGIDFNYVNNGKGEGLGLEVAADWRARSWLRLVLTYAYLHSSFEWENPAIALDAFQNFIEGLTPEHQLGLRTSVTLSDKWQLNAWLRYTDPIECRNSLNLLQVPLPVDNYYLLDLNLIWTPKPGLELMLAGQNVLGGDGLQYISEVNTPPTDIQRGVYTKLTWRF